MDEVCKELDELKAAMKKLTVDFQAKVELSESLKKAHSEQLVKIQEAKTEIEKQVQELYAQRDEISLTRQMYEELKSDLYEKESMLRHLSSANNQLRTSSDEKLQKLETENRKLVSTLEEANAKTEDQGQKICAYKEEIEDLKGLLSISQKKCLDAEERAKAPVEVKQRDDMLMRLEQEKREVSDQLKWRNEQFNHLEEAHDKLQDQFRESKEEWELERSTLIDEACSLQTNLESQIRVSEGLCSQFQMCNQALAHEESRRKLLEIQLSESKKCYENVVAEYQGAQSMIESLTARRDRDIAELRGSLAMKETVFKEMEFVKERLEQENQELLGSLKELQEAQISQTGAAPLSKLRQKLRVLEQVHKDCSAVLKAKEAEWSFKTEKMETELEDLRQQFLSLEQEHKRRETEASVLVKEAEKDFMQEKERFLRIVEERGKMVDELQQQIVLLEQESVKRETEAAVFARIEADKTFNKEKDGFLQIAAEKDSRIDDLQQQIISLEQELANSVEMKQSEINTLYKAWENTSAAWILSQVEIEERKHLIAEQEEEFDGLKKKLEMEEKSLSDLRFLRIVEEKGKMVDELQQQIVLLKQESVKRETEAAVFARIEADKTFNKEKDGFLQIAAEKDSRIDDLQQQIMSLEQELANSIEMKQSEINTLYKAWENTSAAWILSQVEIEERKHLIAEQEEEFDGLKKKLEMEEKSLSDLRFLRIVEEKGKMADELQQQIVLLEQESVKRETEAAVFTRIEADKTFNKEKDGFLKMAAEKDNRIDDLQQQIMSLEQELTNSVEMKQSEINALYKACENISADWILSQVEIEERKHLIAEQEEEFDGLKKKLEMEEKSLSDLKKLIEQLEAELVMKRLEREREMGRYKEIVRGMESTVLKLESQVEELEAEKKELLEVNARLELEKDKLVGQMVGFCDQLDGFSRKDAELMVSLERIAQIAENENVCNEEEEQNINSHSKRKAEVSNDERSPLKVLNS